MQKSLIFLRSFGDFAMAISVLRQSRITDEWTFYASAHLEPLYKELIPFLPNVNINIHFVDIGIRKNVFGYFTNRHSIEFYSMVELLNLKKVLRELNGEIHFEQRKKQWFIAPVLGRTYPFIHDHTCNVYESFCRKFNVPIEHLHYATASTYKHILILPESRKPSKALPPSFIEKIKMVAQEKGKEVQTAYFKKQNATSYHSFTELIEMIMAADLIITADSLPAHLAQLLQKPHFIYYPDKMNEEWITPFAKTNHMFGKIGHWPEQGLNELAVGC